MLAIQGPPGSGKTYRAAEMIVALVRAGKRVGVTSNSHRVIKSVLRAVAERDAALRLLHIEESEETDAPFEFSKDYARVRARLSAGELDVVGGTSWAWVTEHLEHSVDVLVVDEAGQMSLANVLAVSSAAQSMVLFGDLLNLPIPVFPQALTGLFPADWSQKAVLRATAGIMAAAAIILFLTTRNRRPAPVDVADHSGRI